MNQPFVVRPQTGDRYEEEERALENQLAALSEDIQDRVDYILAQPEWSEFRRNIKTVVGMRGAARQSGFSQYMRQIYLQNYQQDYLQLRQLESELNDLVIRMRPTLSKVGEDSWTAQEYALAARKAIRSVLDVLDIAEAIQK